MTSSTFRGMIYHRYLGKIGHKTHGSFYVTLPAAEIKRLGWHEGEMLFVRTPRRGQHLIVEKANYRPRRR